MRGRFRVFNLREPLKPPVNWLQDPEHSHRYRQNLQKLRFLKPLLDAYQYDRNEKALHQALALGLDWIRSNPRGGQGTSPDAWTGKVIGDRVPYLGFLDSAAQCEHLKHAARILDASLAAHGGALADPAAYIPDNHGLFVDTGLYLVTRYAPDLPKANAWARLAKKRFERTLRGRLSQGVWLEHSSFYEFLVLAGVENFLGIVGRDPPLAALDRQMRRAAGWFVQPDRRISQLGDSYQLDPPGWAQREARRERGLRIFREAGFAMVRANEHGGQTGYLTVTDGFHNLTHKHADELSFELYDRGHRLVADSGLYDKDPGPIRDFDLSAQAHSTLTVDGRSYPIADPGAVYGSGLEAAGSKRNLYAIEGRNRMLSQQGVGQQRLFLYEPGVGLQVIDWITSPETHSYDSYLQLGPDVRTSRGGPGVLSLHAQDLEGTLYETGTNSVTATAVRGSRSPYAGFTSPQFRKLVPRTTVDMRSTGSNEVQTYSIALDSGSQIHVGSVHGGPGNATINLVDANGDRVQRIGVNQRGRRLELTTRSDSVPF